MNLKPVLYGAAGLMLASAVAFAGQADVAKITKLKNPAAFTEKAPATYKAKLDTSKGVIVITVHRDWAPNGADRFFNLVKNGFYDDVRFFRVIPNFMAQFGIHGNPSVMAAWRPATLKDDPTKQSNLRGFVTFATAGPNTRTTQLFINFKDNSSLDKQGFAPFGEVTTGMDVVDKIYDGYGEGAPRGKGPEQGRIQNEGNAYLTKDFPRMDYIKTATIAE
ncbi:MAG TPA: peptidylprolyl isomerase [Vicinamibacterales bacterium]|nr:peptidylprolyl isomerase [Vicinamibacterales bacterium]